MDLVYNLKVLSIIAVFAAFTFHIVKPYCIQYMSAENFDRRRNLWFALTVAAFISPSIWLYFLVALPLIFWSARKETNPLALFVLLMYVIPPYEVELPTILIGSLFPISNIRFLTLVIIAPAAAAIFFSKAKQPTQTFKIYDFLIISFIFLQLVLFVPYEAITNTMRRGLVSFLDIWLIYYVTSRVTSDRKSMLEVMAVFCLSCAIFAPIALFESLKTWLLYSDLAAGWDVFFVPLAYLYREGVLRAQASTGHALNLGGIMTVGFGFWLGLSSGYSSKLKKLAGTAWIWLGLLAAYSRAPWLCAAAIYILNKGLGPEKIKTLLRLFLIGGLVFGALLASPLGSRIIDNLPFIGTVDEENVTYRQQLAEKSWELVQKNPVFGDPFFMTQMEDLRQGEGIIDLVNAYAAVALSTGLVGLALFVLPILIGLIRAYKRLRLVGSHDEEYKAMNIALITTVIGSLLLIGSGGIGRGQGHYLLISMLVGLTQITFNAPTTMASHHR